MQLSAELEACLREFAAAGPADLHENGARIAPLCSLSWEVRGKSEKPLLHLWSENHNLTQRVLAITDHSEQRLALAVECCGRAKPDRLEFLRIEFDRSANSGATFTVQPGYTWRASRKVIPREFFGKDPPAGSGGVDRGLWASHIF